MCRGEENSAIVALSSTDSTVKWQLEQHGESWRLAIRAEARPNVDVSATGVKLELSGAGEEVILPMPPMAMPIEISSAACKYSKKRCELVLEWTRQETQDAMSTQAAKATKEHATEGAQDTQAHVAEDKTPTGDSATDEAASDFTEAPATDEAESDSTEVPATQESGSTETSAAEEKESDAAEQTGSTEVPAPKETASSQDLKSEDPVLQQVSAEEFKTLGNEAIKRNDIEAALEHYNNGIRVEPDHHLILSNRALCHHKLGNFSQAAEDALRVTALKPDFYKGYIRGAMALRELKRPQEALALLKKAPHNDEVGKLVSEVRPEAEAAEEARIASLDGAEKLKEEGNALFKKGLYEQAMPKYSEIIEKFPDAASELMVAVRNNRAACNHQLSNFHAVIQDSTWVLEREPDNLKALVRRMIALEPLEKYEKALEDARRVLRHCPGHEVANKVQHRLGRLVRQGY
jgi:stress-induced-phosphoprotein 1